MPKFEAVILDMDGTLVDSNDHHAKAWCDALAEYQMQVPFETVRRLIGMGSDKLLPAVTGLTEDDEQGKQIIKLRKRIFKDKYLPQIRALPGAHDLLVRLDNVGLRLAVATSAEKDILKAMLELIDAEDLLETATSSSDAENSKPDPDIVEAALKALKLQPEQAVMVGDTPYDIQAAAKAGIATIAFRSGGWQDADLEGALAIYDGPGDLLQKFEASPLANRT